jgi:hypothetical protein
MAHAIEILSAHLRVFISAKYINHRLIATCQDFWTRTTKLPELSDLVGICKSFRGHHDQLLGTRILGKSVEESARLYDLFLRRFISCFGIFPSTEDTEASFNFYRHEGRFPNQIELTEMDFILQEANNVNGDNHQRKKPAVENLDKLAKYTASHEMKDTACAICLSNLVKGDVITSLPSCGHIFHHGSFRKDLCEGIYKWLGKNNECPVCRKVVCL